MHISDSIRCFSYLRYEDDPLVGHRLYREIREAEVVKVKTKGSKILPNVTYQWETVATNFDEFQDVSVSLNYSKLLRILPYGLVIFSQ